MKLTNHITGTIGFVLCGALFGALSGCVGYVEDSRPRAVYAPPPPAVYVAPPAVEVSFVIRGESDFYEPLTPYGRWEVVGAYGRCWIPGRVEADWHPYSNGYWQRTDAGWYWASDEPWAWATYHYGRWDFTPQFGWYWVPQTQWAPAWVSWHHGGGYVGWAPLHPSARIAVSGAVTVGVIAPRAYVFVEERQFLEPVRPATVVVNNSTIINKTVNITNIKIVNNTVINEGPRTTVIEQVSGQKVRAVPVHELRRKQDAEIVARQRVATPAIEKTIQPPVRTQAAPVETKAVPPPEPRLIGEPTVIKHEPIPAVPEKRPLERVRVQPVPTPVDTKVEVKHETKPVVTPITKPVVHHGAEQLIKERRDLNRKQGGTNLVDKVHK